MSTVILALAVVCFIFCLALVLRGRSEHYQTKKSLSDEVKKTKILKKFSEVKDKVLKKIYPQQPNVVAFADEGNLLVQQQPNLLVQQQVGIPAENSIIPDSVRSGLIHPFDDPSKPKANFQLNKPSGPFTIIDVNGKQEMFDSNGLSIDTGFASGIPFTHSMFSNSCLLDTSPQGRMCMMDLKAGQTQQPNLLVQQQPNLLVQQQVGIPAENSIISDSVRSGLIALFDDPSKPKAYFQLNKPSGPFTIIDVNGKQEMFDSNGLSIDTGFASGIPFTHSIFSNSCLLGFSKEDRMCMMDLKAGQTQQPSIPTVV